MGTPLQGKKQYDADDNPVIIIAAARSGTKMLRAALAASPEFVDFPYDINYIWKYGNYHIPHDELTEDNLTDDVRKFIRKRFQKLLVKSNAKRVLEKTVSNSLRVDFVREVFPNSKIIHLYRNGRDVAADAKLCWQSSMFSARIQPKSDLFKKVVEFPIDAAWPYLISYVSTYATRLLAKEKHVKSWGPRFKAIEEAIRQYSLIEVCGIQWARSIERSLQSLSRLVENKDYINIRYEDLVQNPVEELAEVVNFLNIKDFKPIKEYGENRITKRYLGFWQDTLSSDEIEKLLPHINKYLRTMGYE